MPRSLVPVAAVTFICACSGNNPMPDAGTPDAGVDAGIPDAGSMVGLTCGHLLSCDQACSAPGCTDGCYANATGVAEGLFTVFNGCLNATCPSTDGGPCQDRSSTACRQCDTRAATGACISRLTACEGDTLVAPPGDGGAVFPTAGVVLNCGALVACQANCPYDAGTCSSDCTGEATPEAISLQSTLASCLEMACPSTDGGPCAMPGLACAGCHEQVTLAMPNTCAAPYVACNSDTSNDPDGGSGPRVLFDGGVISVVVSGLDQAASTLIASGGYIYFTQVTSNSPLLRVRIGGDGGFEAVGPNHPTPVSVAVDDNNAYVWAVGSFGLNSSTNNHDGTVVQVPLDGGSAITLYQGMEVFYDAAYLNAVAIDSRNVYWVAGASGNDGMIMETPIGTANNAVTLYTNQQVPQAVVTDGTHLFWANWGTFDNNGRSNNDGTVWQGSVDGGTAMMLASNQPAPSSLTVDAQFVYWCNLGFLGGDNFPAPNTGSVWKAPIGGGTLTLIAGGQAVPVSIIMDRGTLYWSQYGLSAPGLIMSGPNQGDQVVPLVAGLPDPAALVFSGNALYWTNLNSSPTDGSIWALSPL